MALGRPQHPGWLVSSSTHRDHHMQMAVKLDEMLWMTVLWSWGAPQTQRMSDCCEMLSSHEILLPRFRLSRGAYVVSRLDVSGVSEGPPGQPPQATLHSGYQPQPRGMAPTVSHQEDLPFKGFPHLNSATNPPRGSFGSDCFRLSRWQLWVIALIMFDT